MLESRSPAPRRRVTGIDLPFTLGGLTTEVAPELEAGLRRKLGQLLDGLEENGSGLLITVDGVRSRVADLRQLAALTQHLIRDVRQFALVLAGFPSAVVAMSADDGPSRMADIRRSAGGAAPQHGNTYRNRLLAAGVITQASRGKVDSALPYLREFLREHGAAPGLVPDPEP